MLLQKLPKPGCISPLVRLVFKPILDSAANKALLPIPDSKGYKVDLESTQNRVTKDSILNCMHKNLERGHI